MKDNKTLRRDTMDFQKFVRKQRLMIIVPRIFFKK